MSERAHAQPEWLHCCIITPSQKILEIQAFHDTGDAYDFRTYQQKGLTLATIVSLSTLRIAYHVNQCYSTILVCEHIIKLVGKKSFTARFTLFYFP